MKKNTAFVIADKIDKIDKIDKTIIRLNISTIKYLHFTILSFA